MKLRVRKSRVSQKEFDYPAFEQIHRKGEDDPRFARTGKKKEPRIIRQRQPIAGQKSCGIGYISLLNLTDIAQRLQEDREQFGRCLNEFIDAVREIVTDAGGKMQPYSLDGILFLFDHKGKKSGATQAAVTGLKIRYRMNKLNRSWDNYHADAWKIRTGVCAGPVTITEMPTEFGHEIEVTGEFAELAKAVSRSAGSGQVLVVEDAYKGAGFNKALFETGNPRVLQPTGADYATKVREIVAMLKTQY
jgi:class 3 adenylate cyclase